MKSLRLIKNRIKSVANTSQITKAMEMVAASKMRRAQEYALESRFFSVKALELLSNLLESGAMVDHYLTNEFPDGKTCFLVIMADKGLCGGHNSSVLDRVLREARQYDRDKLEIIAVGKKGAEFLERKGFNVAHCFSGFGDYAHLKDTSPVAGLIMDRQKNDPYREVTVFYSKFISTLKQTVFTHRVLPLDFSVLREIAQEVIPEAGKYSEFRKDFLQAASRNGEYVFEPSVSAVAGYLLPGLFEIEIHSMILEANASEHSARMVAMKNASDNAKDILSGLKLIYNTARQASITKEISEISAGAEALKA